MAEGPDRAPDPVRRPRDPANLSRATSSTSDGDLVAEADSWCFRTDRDQAREQGTKYDRVKAPPPQHLHG